jgi:hypothetical protein
MDMPANPSDSPADSVSSKSPAPYAWLTHYGAVDWARGHHDLCVVDAAGSIVLQLRLEDTPEAWADLRQRLGQLKAPDGSPAVVGFAIETSAGPAVERLLEAQYSVFPLNPKAAERYRDRKCPSGPKSRSRQRWPAWRAADSTELSGRKGPRSCLMRSSVDATLAIRGLLWVGELDTTILAGGCVLRKCSKYSYVAELRLK